MKSFKEISKGMLSEGGEMYPADEMTMKEIKIACYAARNILERLEDGAMIQRWQISAIVKASDELASVYTSMSADEGMEGDDEYMMDDEHMMDDEDHMMDDEDEMGYDEYGYPSMYEAYSEDDIALGGSVIYKHGNKYLYAKAGKKTGDEGYPDTLNIDEVFASDYKGMLGTFKRAVEKAEAAHKKGDDKAKADNIENARMRLRGMKNVDIAKLKNTDHYDRFKKLNEDMDYSVEIEGLPKMYVKGKSPMDVKAILRKIVKKPDMIQNVERTTKSQLRKAFMLKAQGKDEDEDA